MQAAEKWAQATITDNIIFGWIFSEHPELLEKLLKICLPGFKVRQNSEV